MAQVASYSVLNGLAGVLVGTALDTLVPPPEQDKDAFESAGIVALQIVAVGIATALYTKLYFEPRFFEAIKHNLRAQEQRLERAG